MGAPPLEKKFTYRSVSGASLEDHAEHWANFTWRTGPVIVQHKGCEWGTPQVWAESAAEGKRVINHAAAIAGIDTSQGQWVVSGTLHPRYGRRATVGVKLLRDHSLAVSMREGPAGQPEVMGLDP